MLVEPAAGRAAFFSSGWENIHGIKPLTAGARWAFSVPFMVSDELERNHRAREEVDRLALARRDAVALVLCLAGQARLNRLASWRRGRQKRRERRVQREV